MICSSVERRAGWPVNVSVNGLNLRSNGLRWAGASLSSVSGADRSKGGFCEKFAKAPFCAQLT